MYFIKQESLADGRVVKFHRVVDSVMDMASGQGVTTLGSWESLERMIARTAPDFRRIYSFAWVSENITDDAFHAVKATADFYDAEVVE